MASDRENPNKRAIRFAWLWILAVCGIFAVALILSPAADSQPGLSIAGTSVHLPELCQFKQIFGRDCPGCGMTRSFVYSARLQLSDAWSVQPIGTLLAILLAISVPHRILKIRWLQKSQAVRSTAPFEVSVVVALVVLAYGRWFWNTL